MEQIGKHGFDDGEPAPDSPRGRDSLFLIANLTVEGLDETFVVRVRNISAGGLMAEVPEPIAPDLSVRIEVRGIGWVPGRVAWQTEGRVGIAFDRDIDPRLARKPVAGGNA